MQWKSAGKPGMDCPSIDPNAQRMKAALHTIGIVAAMVLAISTVYTCCQIGILCVRRHRQTRNIEDLEAVLTEKTGEGKELVTHSRGRSTTPKRAWSSRHNPFKPSAGQQRARTRSFNWKNNQMPKPSNIPVLS